jgi:PAS domain S-box-containing protein
MQPILTLLFDPPYSDLPTSIIGWVGWLVFLGVIVAFAVGGRKLQRRGRPRGWLLALFLLLVPLANLFLGLRLSSGSALPEPGIPSAPHNPILMVFSALPWMLAGGFLGPVDALLVGLLTGLSRCLWDTHNLYTILEPALLAVLFSLAVRQRYRTLFYRALRQPILIGLGLALLYALIFIGSSLFSVSGTLAARLDFALTNVLPASLAVGGELLAAGLFAQGFALALPRPWGGQEPLQPSPSESSLQTRFLLGGGTFIVVLLVALILGNWIVAGNAARRMLRERLASIAQSATETVPFFFETGQNLILEQAADARLLGESAPDLSAALGEQMLTVPYFDQLFVLDPQGNLLAAYPQEAGSSFGLVGEEAAGLPLAMQGVAVQTYTIPAAAGGEAARISFMTPLLGKDGVAVRILIGRSELASNPLTQPLMNGLRGMQSMDGTGRLLDDQGRVLYSPNVDEVMTVYAADLPAGPQFYEIPAPRGTRNLVYYQPAAGQPWAVVLTVPAEQAQQLALDIAAPMTIFVLLMALVALVALRLSLRSLTASLRGLATEAGRFSQGKLDHPLPAAGVDEVGQLSRAFEQMRLSLHARLEELNQLLLVSQGAASTLELKAAVQPILEAVLAAGASAACVALALPASAPWEDEPRRFALGPSQDRYAALDGRILALAEKQGKLVFKDLNRARGLGLAEGESRPGGLIAVALYHEDHYYGVLWAAFDEPHSFSDETVRFLSTLAGHAALAAANAGLFRAAEVGRQRLAAILASTPDPVLVTDQEHRLILANPAAKRALGAPIGTAEGQPTEQVIGQQELRDLLQELEGGKKSAEVVMPDGRVYFATASAVMADGRQVGRVCVMRDVTHFKQLDALKSDFVSTVSHDLRSPLTLMRGYATMLEMVGKLNEQQHSYVSKIIIGVESMSRMVNNLLDLGRIEAGVGLQVDSVPVKEIVEGVMDALQLQADQKADRALLQQAVYNLAENAIKYTPEGGQVTLRVRSRPGELLYEVQDNGIGIPPADQARIFEKFYRGSQREARAQRGSGLGLAMVRSIAEQHGGRVWLESQQGQGSTFYLLIPLNQPEGIRKREKAV